MAIGQFILSFTRFGRNLYMVGSNFAPPKPPASSLAHRAPAPTSSAGLCTALLGSTDGRPLRLRRMEHGIGYDYQAISAVLVGGTAIRGGEGSALRTFSGAFIIALVQGLLLLNGFSTQMQYLTSA